MRDRALVDLLYTLAIAFLMVSRLPVFSGKRVGKRVPPEMVLPVFVFVVLFFALLIAYPWWVLTIGTLAYLAACRSAGCRIATIAHRCAHHRGLASPRATRRAPPPPRPEDDRGRHGSIEGGQETVDVTRAGVQRRRPPSRRYGDPRLRPAQEQGKAPVASRAPAVDLDLRRPTRLARRCAAAGDGALVEIVAGRGAADRGAHRGLATLARLAWPLGDRHVPVQVLANTSMPSRVPRSRRCSA